MANHNQLMTILTSVLTSAATVAVINYFASSEIERQKFIYNILATALEVSSIKEREERLRFLLETGFITESPIRENLQAKLDRAQTDPAGLPQIRQITRISRDIVAMYADNKADPQLCTKYSQVSAELDSVGELQGSRSYSKMAEKYCTGLNAP